ncbi:MAG: aspartate/glutamate racemase family protein [Candidatus Hodarchaeota archaeon]
MYGWRAKLGLLVPAANGVCEMEFHKLISNIEGICLYTTRMGGTGKLTISSLTDMLNEVDDAAEKVAQAKVDLIVFACTTGSLVKGVGYDQEIIKKIYQKTGIPGFSTSTAVINALKEMGINKIAVATPYTDEVDQRVRSFLEGNGFQVLNLKGLGIVDTVERSELSPIVAYRLAREVYNSNSEADGVFISCMNFRTVEIIESLERDLSKPVVTSLQATVWAALRKLGIHEPINGYGKLLREKI